MFGIVLGLGRLLPVLPLNFFALRPLPFGDVFEASPSPAAQKGDGVPESPYEGCDRLLCAQGKPHGGIDAIGAIATGCASGMNARSAIGSGDEIYLSQGPCSFGAVDSNIEASGDKGGVSLERLVEDSAGTNAAGGHGACCASEANPRSAIGSGDEACPSRGP